jgi:ABC-type Mn2+/Zn2+ transport system ATPase subunit
VKLDLFFRIPTIRYFAQLLILDGPTVGLDRKSSTVLMDIVRDANDQGHTIIIMVADAQKTRGLDLEKGSFITRPKSYMPIIVSVIITGESQHKSCKRDGNQRLLRYKEKTDLSP